MRYNKAIGIVLGLLLCAMVPARAQSDTARLGRWPEGMPKATLKINVAALSNLFRPSLFFASDIYLTPNVILDVGAGWFFASSQLRYQEESQNGYRQRLGFKYVFLPQRRVSPYVGVEGKLNYIREKRIGTLLRYGEQYSETVLVNKTLQTYGAAVRGGFHFNVDTKRRLAMDLYMGLGYKYVKVDIPVPPDARLVGLNQGFIPIERGAGQYHLPDFLLGFAMGYSFH